MTTGDMITGVLIMYSVFVVIIIFYYFFVVLRIKLGPYCMLGTYPGPSPSSYPSFSYLRGLSHLGLLKGLQ